MDLDEDLARAVAAAVVSTAKHGGNILDDSAVKGEQSPDQRLIITQVAGNTKFAIFLRRDRLTGSKTRPSDVYFRVKIRTSDDF